MLDTCYMACAILSCSITIVGVVGCVCYGTYCVVADVLWDLRPLKGAVR
jgi:hypothetical protein